MEETASTSLQAISREDDSDDEEMCIPEEDGQGIDYEQLGLKVTATERFSQHHSELWQNVRYKRITGSICGRVLCQKKKTDSLLMYCLYPKPLLDPLPAPIMWGR